MQNLINADGDKNIIIQDIKESTITINVNGELQEIHNDLEELKKLLQGFQLETFQQNNKTYNINHLNNASFDFLTGKQAFNEWLAKNLIIAIKPNSKDAVSFLEWVENKSSWGKDELNDAKQIIVSSYVGVLGIQLRKLMAIGQEKELNKTEKYIENAAITANISIELACFALISGFWDSKEGDQSLPPEPMEQLQNFFDKKMERELPAQFEFMMTLLEIYQDYNISFPIPELKEIVEEENCKNNLKTACISLQNLIDEKNYTLIDCYEAEKNITTVLSCMSFWAAYKMASIKMINYDETRNYPSHYLHKYTRVGFAFKDDYKLESNPKQIDYVKTPINTDAVLLYKDQYNKSINLFPFVIDLNALASESGLKICFYSSRHYKNKNLLMYRFLENYSIENIVFEDTLLNHKNDMNNLMADDEARRKYKLDLVYLLFQQARETILGKAT